MKIFASILLLIFLMTTISASSGYCISVEVSDITPSSVGIDESFTVEVQVESCDSKTPENVSLELFNPSSDILVKEDPTIYIGKLGYANSKRSVVYHMQTTDNARKGEYQMKLIARGKSDSFTITTTSNFTITVNADPAKLNIASAKIDPIIPREGDTVELTLRIENFGKGDANSIKVELEHPFEGGKEAFMGTLESDEDGPAVFTFIANKKGEFEFPVKINYEDDFGSHQIVSKLNVNILGASTNWINILFIFIIIIVIIAFILYYLKTKEDKEKIIQQILKGNNHNTEVNKKKKTKKR